MNTLTIYRSAAPLITVNIDERTKFSHKLMGEHKVSAEFFLPSYFAITIGDYITVGSVNFYANRIPSIVKMNNKTYKYNIDFESIMYDLGKKIFMSIDDLAEYGRTGNAEDFVDDIVTNMNASFTGWSKGTVASTDEKTIVFSNENCWQALIKVAETFGLEFSLTEKSISLVKSVGVVTALEFEYGRDNGLYQIERQQIKDQNIVTKVFGFGSTANIPYTYRDRAKRLVFEERFLTKNTEIFGIIEGQYTNNDIFPNRTGTLTAENHVFVGDVWDPKSSWVEDTALNGASGFNINDNIMDGLDPMIVFKSGDLSGQEFVIWKYDPVTARIYFNQQSDEDGYTTPNPTNTPQVGDLYTLVNISLPQMYIDQAEVDLRAATQAYLDENSVPRVVYTVEIDPKFARNNAITINVGDRVTIVDVPLGINSQIRVSGIEYPLVDQYQFKCYIADFVPYTQQERIILKTVTGETETRIVDRTSDELARRNAMRQRQLKDLIFDSDGYFDVTNIRPLSIETMYLSVGTASQNFHLSGVRLIPNYQSDPNRLYISAGELHHHEMEIEGQGSNWVIGGAYDSGAGALTPNLPYYIYAKCSTTQLTGQWVVSSSQIHLNDEPGYYHFVVGILYDVFEDWRDYDFTYGMTYINGRIITTGKIQTLDGQNWIDLDQNEFVLGYNQGNGLTWQDGALIVRGMLVQRSGQEVFPVLLFRGNYAGNTVYHKGDMVMYNGSSWVYINETPASGIFPAEGEYWTLQSAIGQDGAPGSSPVGMFRGTWNAGTDYYGTMTRVDIVYNTFDQLYYIAVPRDTTQPFKGLRPDLYPAYWSNFGANYENIATNFIFAENSVLENVRIRFFEGIPASVGDLGMAPESHVDNVQACQSGTARIDYVEFTDGTYGSANLTCNGVTRLATFYLTLDDTASKFVSDWFSDYYQAGVLLSHESATNRVLFTEVNGNDFQGSTLIENVSGDLYGSSGTTQSHVDGQVQIDTVTISGTGGTAYIRLDGIVVSWLYFEDNIANTIDNWIDRVYSTYYDRGIEITRSGNDIVCTGRYKGDPFTSPEISNIPNIDQGALSIASNQIWDDQTNGPAVILFNYKGYQGGYTYGRTVKFGNGLGNVVMEIGRSSSMNQDVVEIDCDMLWVNADKLTHSPDGFVKGTVYIDANGFVKVKQS